MATKYFNLDTDSTLSANSDYLIASQKAIKTALDKKVDKTITINNKSLDGNITLEPSDIGALPDTTFIPTKVSDVENDNLYISENDLNNNSIIKNNNKVETIAVIEQNRSFPTGLWVGTLTEYEIAVENGEISDTTLCYITDDEDNNDNTTGAISSFVSNVITTIPQNVTPYLSVTTTPYTSRGNEANAWTNSNGETIYTIKPFFAPSDVEEVDIYDDNDTIIGNGYWYYTDGYVLYNDVRYDYNNEINESIHTSSPGSIETRLKMGAITYIPNGTDYTRVSISEDVISDKIIISPVGISNKEYYYVVYDNTNKKLHLIKKENFKNTLTEPVLENGAWYDTLNKKIYLYVDSIRQDAEISLPLGIISAYVEFRAHPSVFPYHNTDSVIASITYFDAFGYIGTYSPITVFVLPGLSGIVANGRFVNTGYMNNIEYTVKDVIVSNISGNGSYSLAFTVDNTIARYESYKLKNDNYLYGDDKDIVYGVEFMNLVISEVETTFIKGFTTTTVQLATTDLVETKADASTTLEGYGIENAYTKNEVDTIVGDIGSILDEINGELV